MSAGVGAGFGAEIAGGGGCSVGVGVIRGPGDAVRVAVGRGGVGAPPACGGFVGSGDDGDGDETRFRIFSAGSGNAIGPASSSRCSMAAGATLTGGDAGRVGAGAGACPAGMPASSNTPIPTEALTNPMTTESHHARTKDMRRWWAAASDRSQASTR
ncbi:MAG TPA: hypothetical protein VJ782_09655 [Aeromicrobium sp.]|nr:hypothetical protein [Aeromicrobium sp.]